MMSEDTASCCKNDTSALSFQQAERDVLFSDVTGSPDSVTKSGCVTLLQKPSGRGRTDNYTCKHVQCCSRPRFGSLFSFQGFGENF